MKALSRTALLLLSCLVLALLASPVATLTSLGDRLHWFGELTSALKVLWPGVAADHLIAFGVIGFVFRLAYPRVPPRFGLLALLAASVLTEWMQTFAPGREPHVGDALTDVAGGAAGYALAWVLQAAVRRRP
jgi:VanZ like family